MAVSWMLMGHDPTEEQVREHLMAMARKHGLRDAWRAIAHGEELGFYSDGVFVPYGSLPL